ncbi:MAG: outer membrane protein transport protein [Nitrospirota bacterium]
MTSSRCTILIICIIIILSHLRINTASAQVEVSSTLNPVGSGARAAGMGGAFIGIADDATAASWNPAGLVQLERPEISAVYSYFHRRQEYNSPSHPEIAAENTMDTDGLNYASIVFPFVLLKRNMVVSVNYQRLFEMSKDITYSLDRQVLGSTLTDHIEFRQYGFLYTISPALSVQITPRFSIGGTLNIWDNALGRNGWKSSYDSVLSGKVMGNPIEIKFSRQEEVSFGGLNAHAGFLWHINDSLTVGGVYKTAFEAGLKKKIYERQDPQPAVISEKNMVERMPPSYGLGLAYRHSDNWTTSLDMYRTEWSRFVIRDEEENEINPLDSTPISDGRLKDTTQFRLGTEYLFIHSEAIIPVRAGLFYDPEPAKGHIDEFYGFSLGTGYARGSAVFDISYQFRTGNNVTGDIPSVEGSQADIKQHTAMFSLCYYFNN